MYKLKYGKHSVLVEIPMSVINYYIVVKEATTPEHVKVNKTDREKFIVEYPDDNSLGEALSRFSGLVKHRIMY